MGGIVEIHVGTKPKLNVHPCPRPLQHSSLRIKESKDAEGRQNTRGLKRVTPPREQSK
jgi:hypothetical protein